MIGLASHGTTVSLSPSSLQIGPHFKRSYWKVGISSCCCLYVSFDTPVGHPRFFLGSDSAPHLPHTKATSSPDHGCAAGIYTSPILLPLVAHLLDTFGALDKLENFVSANGRAFYRTGPSSPNGRKITLRKAEGTTIATEFTAGSQSVTPFWSGRALNWEIV